MDIIGNNSSKGSDLVKNSVILKDIAHFDIKQILESGQVFRYQELSDRSYVLIAKQKVIKIVQQLDSTSVIFYHTTIGEFEEIWKDYFDIDTSYASIIKQLETDLPMQEAIAFGKGIRILRQDPWEMLISFIISQNKAIPHIRQCIENISQTFGECMASPEGLEEHVFYSFPTPEQLGKATEEELRACKVGFRAPYIIDACKKVNEQEVCLTHLYTMTSEKAREELMKIKGVGPKIADCILLFAYGKGEVFPTDVWIKRVIEGLYFEGEEQKLNAIQQFAKETYGELAGYAQQYLFFCARENNLFKNIKTN